MSTIERLIEWRGYGSPVTHNRSPTKFARDVIELMQQHQEMLEALKALVEPAGAPTEQAYLDAIAAIARTEGRS